MSEQREIPTPVCKQPKSGQLVRSRHPRRRGAVRDTERMSEPLDVHKERGDEAAVKEIEDSLSMRPMTEGEMKKVAPKETGSTQLGHVHEKLRARAERIYEKQNERLLPEHPVCDEVWQQAKAQFLLQENKGGIGRIIAKGEELVLPRNMTIPAQKRTFKTELQLPLMTDLNTAARRYGAPGAKTGESLVLEQRLSVSDLVPVNETPVSSSSTSSASSAAAPTHEQLAASMCVDGIKAKYSTGDGKQSLALRAVVTGLLPTQPPLIETKDDKKVLAPAPEAESADAKTESKEAKVEEKKEEKAPAAARAPKWHNKLYDQMKAFLQGTEVPTLQAIAAVFDVKRQPVGEEEKKGVAVSPTDTIANVLSKANGFKRVDLERFLSFEAISDAHIDGNTRLDEITAEQTSAIRQFTGYTFCEPVRKALLASIPKKEEVKEKGTSEPASDDGVKLTMTPEQLRRARQIERASVVIARLIYRILRSQGLYDEVVLSNKSEPALKPEAKSSLPLACYHEITRVLEKATRQKALPASAGKHKPRAKKCGSNVECLSIDPKTKREALHKQLDDLLRTGFGDTGADMLEVYRDSNPPADDKMRSFFIDAESRCIAYVATLLQYVITHKGLPEIAPLQDVLRREDLPTRIPAMHALIQDFSKTLSDHLMKTEKLWPGSYMIATLPEETSPQLFENPITALTVYRTYVIAENTVKECAKSLKDNLDHKKYAAAMCVRDPTSQRVVALVYTLRAALRTDEVYRTACHMNSHVLTDSLRVLYFAPTPSSPVEIGGTGVQAPVQVPVFANLQMQLTAYA